MHCCPSDVYPVRLAPPPASLEELTDRADLIAIGTIGEIVRGPTEGPYQGPLPSDPRPGVPQPAGIPVTYFEVHLEEVLAGGDGLSPGDTLMLRIHGVADHETAIGGRMLMPRAGERRLLILQLNPDGASYGANTFQIISIDGAVARFADRERTSVALITGRIRPADLLSDIRAQTDATRP